MKDLKLSRVLTVLLLFALPFTALAQWIKNESLTGGSIVTDIIEFNQSIFVAFNETGIFGSTDQGETWSQMPVPGQFNFIHMVVAGNKLVAISSGTTYFTTNGIDWTSGTGPEAFINDADSEGDIIFAATHGGIYKSIDAGASWLLASDPQVQVSITSISVSGTTVWASAGQPGTLFMSADGGTTWTKINKGTAPASDVAVTENEVYVCIPGDGIYRTTNQGADWQLIRDLSDSYGRMFVSGAGIFYASPYSAFCSKNSGSTWQQKSNDYPYYNFQCLYADNEHIYLGLWGGGMLKTAHTDASAPGRFINNGIACHQIHNIAFEGNKLYAGLEFSFLRISEDLGATWSQKSGPFGLFGRSVDALMVKNGVIYTGSGGGGVLRSTDDGATWAEKNQGLASLSVRSIVSTQNAIFVACDDGVYKSTNDGDSWTKKTQAGITMKKLYTDGTAIYAASFDGLFESKDDGETWTMINGGLPSASVNDVITMGPALFAATQFDGVYKTTDSGTTWTKINDLSVLRFNSHNQYLFMLELSGQLLISGDTAKTIEDIGAALPSGIVTYVGVTGDSIFAAKANKGYWTRKATSLMKPYVALASPRAGNKLSLDESITLKSDQRLFSTAGVVISKANIGTHITIKDKAGNLIEFSADVAPDEKTVTLTIINAEVDETYTVTVSPLLNDNGLSSSAVSANFTVVNLSPTIAEVTINMEDGGTVTFTNEIFEAVYEDEQPMDHIIVKTLPSHGQLKLGDAPVTVNQEIAVNEIDNLTYTVTATLSEDDNWNWNASDGIAYATADAKVTIVIPIVTGISEVSGEKVFIYPNPASSTVQIELFTVAPVSLKVFDVMGRQMSDAHSFSQKKDHVSHVIDTQNYMPGLYLIRVDFGGRQEVVRFTKR